MKKLTQTSLVAIALVATSAGCGGDGAKADAAVSPSSSNLDARDVRPVSLDALAATVEKVTAAQPQLSTESEAFRQALLTALKTEPASRSYDIKSVTSAEWRLLLAYPGYVLKTRDATNAAVQGATDFFKDSQWKTRGDGFRHSFWNVLMAKRIAPWWAESYSTAHESETPNGDDKTMDLSNNAAGRRIFRENSGLSEGQLAEKIRSGWPWEYRPSGVTINDGRIVYMVK